MMKYTLKVIFEITERELELIERQFTEMDLLKHTLAETVKKLMKYNRLELSPIKHFEIMKTIELGAHNVYKDVIATD